MERTVIIFQDNGFGNLEVGDFIPWKQKKREKENEMEEEVVEKDKEEEREDKG